MSSRRMHRFAPVGLLALMIVSCDSTERETGDRIERAGNPTVTYVDDRDRQMTVAIEKARSTADQFITDLNNPKPSQSSFSVKLLIEDGDYGEHMWLFPVRFEGGSFHGTLNNDPDRVTTVKIGDEVSVVKNQISDWMYIEDQKLVGGYTLRVMRDKMSPKEREEFDRTTPFKIE